MATVLRGSPDERILKVQQALEAYEREHPEAEAALYRYNPGAIRVRIIDPRFEKKTRTARHDGVSTFLHDQIEDDTMDEVSVLLLLAPSEVKKSLMNVEFDDPQRSIL